MKQEVIQSIEKVLDDDLKNLDGYSLYDDKKAKALQSIKGEIAIILANEKEQLDQKQKENQNALEKEKFDLEKQRFENEKEVKEKQLELDQQKHDLEMEKLRNDIENSRIQNQTAITKVANDAKFAKAQLIVSIAGVVGTFLLGLVGKIMYSKLAYNAQLHEYNDYQMEPQSSKENRMNLLK